MSQIYLFILFSLLFFGIVVGIVFVLLFTRYIQHNELRHKEVLEALNLLQKEFAVMKVSVESINEYSISVFQSITERLSRSEENINHICDRLTQVEKVTTDIYTRATYRDIYGK